ncbi:MAG: bifunctional 3-(3-hydroxy-phenyl)propionate/3-hydroxycinnamic acid hydroxylase [Rhodomicrobium sp.]
MTGGETAVHHVDAIIVGLGPTGALLANLLGQEGLSIVCIERDTDIYYAPKAVHFDDEIMRIFQSAGLSDEISKTSEPFSEMAFRLKPGGKEAWRAKVGTQGGRYGHAGAWWFHQPTLERHLRGGFSRFPNVQVLLGLTVTEVTQDGSGVTVTAEGDGGRRTEVRGSFAIGCDGGRSTVRRLAEIALDSADFDQPWVVVDTRTRSGKKHPDLPDLHNQICQPSQPVTYVPLAGPYYEWQFMVTGGKSEREATDPRVVREQLKKFVDLNTIEINRIAYYTFHALWAREWRKGRIILAGDSAHQMPPFLGQGMCSGIRDADALAWRLNLILSGRADLDLLDEYQLERGDHVGHIIHGAIFLGSVIQTRHPVIAFFRNRLMFDLSRLIPAYGRFVMYVANRKRPLGKGFFGRNRRKITGSLAPQPNVAAIGRGAVPLDTLMGSGFAVVARATALEKLAPVLPRVKAVLPVNLVLFGKEASPTVVGDSSGALTRFFDEASIDFMIVRPDHYIFDGGRKASFAKVASKLVKRFHAPQDAKLTLEEAA